MTDTDTSRLTRQQLYDRIRESSKDEYILEEMIRIGFWPSGKDAPTLPEQVIRREGELTRELDDLLRKQRRYENKELMLREMRKARMAESRRKQAETKARREEERQARAERWQDIKTREILWLGHGVSGGLNRRTSDVGKLAQNGLPHYDDVKALAKAIGIPVGELRFLAFSRKTSKISHYRRFFIPKKRGGRRLISAPMPRLKALQYFVLENILAKIPPHKAAHGFLPGHSIVTNAVPHVGKDVVINLDLKDFFPTISYPRVKGLFRSLGYSEQQATLFGLICTEPDTDAVELDGETYFVARSERHLPQGAPTSPAISNLIFRKADRRLQGVADQLGFAYTRYADDLTFSASGDAAEALTRLLWGVRQIVKDEGFVLHPDKLRVMKKGARQEVTGIVVNEKLNISRKSLRNFRALLFQIEKDGFEGKRWNGAKNLPPVIWGYANYVAMVNPEKGKPLVAQTDRIFRKYRIRKSDIRPDLARKAALAKKGETSGADEEKPWWKFW
ncbi:RNA-directed DNA polymerase [Desulfonema ishimotonii]|uniref:RNA-directed DNA polymerase n=1 Tax=Desulfonema ishimotonii TaxID=45657 RepID=A0A401FXX4_9BACT|nr:reverse transcriptase domain-containing protein [Desulfonema ishimotonii]GBC61799.1 RNA-directed DNA polymerase [Desulfonema ishimotonii]